MTIFAAFFSLWHALWFSPQYITSTFAPTAVVLPSVVQVKSCSGTSTPVNCSTTANMTAGNVAVVVAMASSGTCSTVTSTPSNTFQPWLVQTSASNRQSVFVARNVASATNTFVVTCTGASSFVSAIIYELSGVTAADVAGSTLGTGGTPSIATFQSVGTGTEEVIASIYDNSNFVTWVAGSGYTIQGTVNASGASHLGASEDNNTKTGLSGVQTATITPVGSDPWTGTIITLASTPTPDTADTYLSFEGLTNATVVTAAALKASTYGVPLTWSISNIGTNCSGVSCITGATAAQLANFPAPHQIGATAWTGSGSLGYSFTTVAASTVGAYAVGTLPLSNSTVSYITQFRTTLPQNDTNTHAYSWFQIADLANADWVQPQLQATGSQLNMAIECKTLTGSGTVGPISSNTTYYVFIQAVSNAGNHVMAVYDSSGTQVGSTQTCTAETGTTSYNNIKFGITGAEIQGAGAIYADNMRISYQGSAMTP